MECGAKRLCFDEGCDQCFKKSFASVDRSRFWSSRNIIPARNISKGSKKKFWFDCGPDETGGPGCGHSFETNVSSITKGSWCPYCAIPSKVLCEDEECDSCYARSFASCEKSQFWSDVNELKPRNVLLNSNKKYSFVCDTCSHEFEGKLDDVKKGQWCPFCAGKSLCSDSCEMCGNRSFSSSKKASFWASWNVDSPADVLLNSHKKYYFTCDKCDHYFDASPDNIAKGNWCPYCAGKSLCTNETCESCHLRSFSSSDRASSWSSQNKISMRDVSKSSNKKHWLTCSECEHEFYSRLDNIESHDSWCPFCAGKSLCEDPENGPRCELCFNHSFASSDKAQWWSETNKKIPRQVFLNSHEKFLFFDDRCGHEFEMRPNNVTNGDQWCPLCKNKTECKLLDYLKTKWERVEAQKKFEWCKVTKMLPYDFYIPEAVALPDGSWGNLLIELDGPQHFKQISNWESPKDIKKRDDLKNASAVENGYFLVRLLQEDVLYDINDWKELFETFATDMIHSDTHMCVTIYEGVSSMIEYE